MRKIITFIAFLLNSIVFYAQEYPLERKDSLEDTSSSKKTNVDFYFQGELESSKREGQPFHSHFQINYAQFNIQGDYNQNLSYRIRFKLNRSFSPTSLDNASLGMDFAYLTYSFGNRRQWEARVGKQYVMVGSYELDIHPLYEYIYSDYINYVINPFTTAFLLGYKVSDTQKVGIQFYNAQNQYFGDYLKSNGFVSGSFVPSKLPIGTYLYWQNSFFSGAFHTNYSYNISQFAKDYYTHMISLGNQLHIGNHKAYLDLMYAHQGVDHGLLLSRYMGISRGLPENNYVMEKDILYRGLVSRYEYHINKNWSVSAKIGVELSGSQRKLSKHLRTNYTYFLSGQYEPFDTQDFRFYLAYIGNTIEYSKELSLPYKQLHRVVLGASYNLPVLKINE